MAKKTQEEKLVDKMLDCLWEVSDLQGEHIDDTNYRKFYEDAANELDIYGEEDEDGECDLARFTYNYLDKYVTCRNELVKLLKEKGLSLEERKTFIQTNLAWEE